VTDRLYTLAALAGILAALVAWGVA